MEPDIDYFDSICKRQPKINDKEQKDLDSFILVKWDFKIKTLEKIFSGNYCDYLKVLCCQIYIDYVIKDQWLFYDDQEKIKIISNLLVFIQINKNNYDVFAKLQDVLSTLAQYDCFKFYNTFFEDLFTNSAILTQKYIARMPKDRADLFLALSYFTNSLQRSTSDLHSSDEYKELLRQLTEHIPYILPKIFAALPDLDAQKAYNSLLPFLSAKDLLDSGFEGIIKKEDNQEFFSVICNGLACPGFSDDVLKMSIVKLAKVVDSVGDYVQDIPSLLRKHFNIFESGEELEALNKIHKAMLQYGFIECSFVEYWVFFALEMYKDEQKESKGRRKNHRKTIEALLDTLVANMSIPQPCSSSPQVNQQNSAGTFYTTKYFLNEIGISAAQLASNSSVFSSFASIYQCNGLDFFANEVDCEESQTLYDQQAVIINALYTLNEKHVTSYINKQFASLLKEFDPVKFNAIIWVIHLMKRTEYTQDLQYFLFKFFHEIMEKIRKDVNVMRGYLLIVKDILLKSPLLEEYVDYTFKYAKKMLPTHNLQNYSTIVVLLLKKSPLMKNFIPDFINCQKTSVCNFCTLCESCFFNSKEVTIANFCNRFKDIEKLDFSPDNYRTFALYCAGLAAIGCQDREAMMKILDATGDALINNFRNACYTIGQEEIDINLFEFINCFALFAQFCNDGSVDTATITEYSQSATIPSLKYAVSVLECFPTIQNVSLESSFSIPSTFFYAVESLFRNEHVITDDSSQFDVTVINAVFTMIYQFFAVEDKGVHMHVCRLITTIAEKTLFSCIMPQLVVFFINDLEQSYTEKRTTLVAIEKLFTLSKKILDLPSYNQFLKEFFWKIYLTVMIGSLKVVSSRIEEEVLGTCEDNTMMRCIDPYINIILFFSSIIQDQNVSIISDDTYSVIQDGLAKAFPLISSQFTTQLLESVFKGKKKDIEKAITQLICCLFDNKEDKLLDNGLKLLRERLKLLSM